MEASHAIDVPLLVFSLVSVTSNQHSWLASLSALLEFPRMFQRLGQHVGRKGETERRRDEEGTIWRGKEGENKVVEDRAR